MMRLLLAILLLVLSLLHACASSSPSLDCSPCISRPLTSLRVILHGTKDSLFWQQVQTAIQQTCFGLRVQLEFELYDRYDPARMAADIRSLLLLPETETPSVLLVSLPTREVQDAVREVVRSSKIRGGVFGMNSGYDKALEIPLLGFVAMDEREAGLAALEHLQDTQSMQRVLFLNHEKGNFALEQRRQGLDASNATIVDELVVESDKNLTQQLQARLKGCPYQAILSGGTIDQLETTLKVTEDLCNTDNNNNHTVLQGVFDTSERVYQLLATGKIHFAIAQQHWLQGAMAAAMAALHATTGMRLQHATERTQYGTYLSGPKVATLSNLPTDTLQVCENRGYPICSTPPTPTTSTTESSACPCFDRSQLRIAAVTHGTRTEGFWIGVRQAAQQAAMDMGVQLDWDLFDPLDDGDDNNADLLYSKMASKMVSLCQSDAVDALVVSIPSEQVRLALETCRSLKVPIVSINANAGSISQELGILHHVAQEEYTAGVLAGQQLIALGNIQRGLCINHGPQLASTNARCNGFQQAMLDANIEYLGMVPAPLDSQDVTKKRIEDAVGKDDNWDRLGLMAMGQILIPTLKAVKQDHPEAVAATFDVSPSLTQALEDDQILFGIDQLPYLQGYMPVLALTWAAQTKQSLANHAWLSGPSFVVEPPTAAQQQCSDTNWPVCPPPVDMEYHYLGHLRILGCGLGTAVLLTAMGFASVVVVQHDKPGIRQSQPFFLWMVAFGAAMMGSALFPNSIDDQICDGPGCDAACMSGPWLLAIGFTFAFAALYSKLMRLNKLIQSAKQFRHIQATAKDVMAPFVVNLLLNVAFLTTWTVVDPMYWERIEVSDTESYGTCQLGDGPVSTAMLACLLGINLLALMAALVQAYKARKMTYELTDAGSVAVVVVSIFQVAVVGIPILPQVRDDPIANYLLTTFLVFVISFSTLLFIFVPVLKKEGVGGGRSALSMSKLTGVSQCLNTDPSCGHLAGNRMDSGVSLGAGSGASIGGGSVAEIRRLAELTQKAYAASSAGGVDSNGSLSSDEEDEGSFNGGESIMDIFIEAESRENNHRNDAGPTTVADQQHQSQSMDAEIVLDNLVRLLKEGTLERKDVMKVILGGDGVGEAAATADGDDFEQPDSGGNVVKARDVQEDGEEAAVAATGIDLELPKEAGVQHANGTG